MLDVLVQDRRSGSAVKQFFKRLFTGLRYKPHRLIVYSLRSYGVA
jgi:transposase-like protein